MHSLVMLMLLPVMACGQSQEDATEDVTTTSPATSAAEPRRLSDVKAAFRGWLLVGVGGSIPVEKVEAASKLTLAEMLNVSESEVETQGTLYTTTTTTTTSTTTTRTTTTSTSSTSTSTSTTSIITTNATTTTNVTTSNGSIQTTTLAALTYSGSMSFSADNLTQLQVETASQKALAKAFDVEENAVTVSAFESRRLGEESNVRRLQGSWKLSYTITYRPGVAGAPPPPVFHKPPDAAYMKQLLENELVNSGADLPQLGDFVINGKLQVPPPPPTITTTNSTTSTSTTTTTTSTTTTFNQTTTNTTTNTLSPPQPPPSAPQPTTTTIAPTTTTIAPTSTTIAPTSTNTPIEEEPSPTPAPVPTPTPSPTPAVGGRRLAMGGQSLIASQSLTPTPKPTVTTITTMSGTTTSSTNSITISSTTATITTTMADINTIATTTLSTTNTTTLSITSTSTTATATTSTITASSTTTSAINATTKARCECSCPATTVTNSTLSSTLVAIGSAALAESRELSHLDAHGNPTTTVWNIRNEYTKYWNVTYTVTVPVAEQTDVKERLENIAGDYTNFNETLWLTLVNAQGVNPSLAEFYDFMNFAFTSFSLITPTGIVPTESPKPWPEITAMLGVGCCWVILLLISYYITFRRSVSHWQKVEQSKAHLDILHSTKSFRQFCSGKGFAVTPAGLKDLFEKAEARWYKKFWKKYLHFLIGRPLKVLLIAGWRYVIGMGLYALTIANCIRAARDLTYDSGERMVSDESIDANMAAAKKVFYIILPFTSSMLLAYLFNRMSWLNQSIEIVHKNQRLLEELGNMCVYLLPRTDVDSCRSSQTLYEVAKARFLLYCYFNTFHLFFFADAAEQMKYGVKELVFQEALSRAKLLLVKEEEELVGTADASTQIFIWISRLVVEIGRSCELSSSRPCLQELMQKLMAMQNNCRTFHTKIKQRAPLSFMQLMHLMVDATVLVTPIAIAETCGADHHSYSFYLFPWICSIFLALFFQGCLRFAMVTEDPFGAGCGGESYANDCLLRMETRLYSLLALRRLRNDEVDLPNGNPEPDVIQEPVWVGEISEDFLNCDFRNDLYPTTPGPEEEDVAIPAHPHITISQNAQTSDADDSLKYADIVVELGNPQEDDVEDDTAFPERDTWLQANVVDDYDYSEGIEDPEELSRPPDSLVSSFDKGIVALPAKSPQERLEEVEKELAETEMERRMLRDLVKKRGEQMLELQAESILAEDANEVVALMSEWVNPKRPVRVSDVTFFKLAELARKQTTRVKKVLALPIAGRSDPYSAAHQHITSASLTATNAVSQTESEGLQLVRLLKQRFDAENKTTSRLRYELAEIQARSKGEELLPGGKKLVKPTKANLAALDKRIGPPRSLTTAATGQLSENAIQGDPDSPKRAVMFSSERAERGEGESMRAMLSRSFLVEEEEE